MGFHNCQASSASSDQADHQQSNTLVHCRTIEKGRYYGTIHHLQVWFMRYCKATSGLVVGVPTWLVLKVLIQAPLFETTCKVPHRHLVAANIISDEDFCSRVHIVRLIRPSSHSESRKHWSQSVRTLSEALTISSATKKAVHHTHIPWTDCHSRLVTCKRTRAGLYSIQSAQKPHLQCCLPLIGRLPS